MSALSYKSITDNPLFRKSLIAVAVIEAIAIVLMHQGVLEFDKKIGLAVFGGLPVLILTLLQLHANSIVQRAGLVKDLASKVHTDKELSETFYSLIYLYTDKRYDAYSRSSRNERDDLNKSKKEGLRFFHLDELEGTEEERRLDSFLGYIDIIAYHYTRELIQMNDLAGVLGFHLATIQSRQAITDYRDSVHKFWNHGSKVGRDYGAHATPLRHLDSLLVDYKAYCKTQSKAP
jgi:hypothetical protein